MKRLHINSRVIFFFILFCLFSSVSAQTTIPDWFDANDYDFVSTSVLGTVDVDLPNTILGEPNGLRDFIIANNIEAGREYFAWLQVESNFVGELLLTSWDSLDENADRENRFDNAMKLAEDGTSSPLGGGAINGFLDANRDFIICIHHISDPNCAYENTPDKQSSDINYSFFIKFAPTPTKINVTCNIGGCLTDGWSELNTANFEQKEIACVNNSCATEGWMTIFPDGTTSTTTCRSRGNKSPNCFTIGQVETKMDPMVGNEVTINTISCKQQSCLNSGWNLRNDDGLTKITCTNSDCSTFGWTGSLRNERPKFTVTCKHNDCFGGGSGYIITNASDSN